MVEASTKSGKTSACLAWLTEQALQAPTGGACYWVAPWYGTAKIAYEREKAGLPRTAYEKNDGDLTLTLLPGGGRMVFRSADKPDALYGDDVHAAVLDEATRMKEEAWHAIRSTVTATRGPARLIGNVKGRKNWAYRLARRAEAGEPDWHYARITAEDAVAAGVLDVEEIASARRDLPAGIFQQLYMTMPADDGGNPFELGCSGAIRRAVRPLSSSSAEAWGWDLGKAVDWTVGVGLDGAGVAAALHRWQGVPWAETVSEIVRLTAGAAALVDSTGLGDPVLEAIQRLAEVENFEGFHYTAQSKQQLMEALAVAIQRGQVGYPDGPVVTELEAFEFEYTRTGVRYSAPEGMHDDCVCALAQAWWMLLRRPAPMTIDTLGGSPATEEERLAEARARQEEAVREVSDAVASQGAYWPEGR